MTAPVQAPLFRLQAIEHATGSLFGTIVLARPVSFAWLTGLFSLIALAIVCFLALYSYTSKAVVQGIVVPSAGTLRVLVPQSGVVTERLVREGSSVKRGDVLFVLTSERSTRESADAGQAVTELMAARRASLERDRASQRDQDRQRIEAAERRGAQLNAELRHIDQQLLLQRRRIALAQETVKRQEALLSAHFISQASVQEKQGELLDQQQRLGDLERARAEAQRGADGARDDMRDLSLQARRNDEAAARLVSALDQDLTESGARRQVTVRATQDGSVTAVTARLGQSLSAGQAMATILPAASVLEVELYAPSRTVGFLRPGMPVSIRYQAYPFQKFGQHAGVVREVTSTVLAQDELPLDAGRGSANAAQEPVYRIRVELARQSVAAGGAEQRLRPGMALEASIALERRKLYEWILGPLYSIVERA
jgi:membrane fusion protein